MRFAERLDPQIAAVLDAVPRLDLTDLAQARRERRELAALTRQRWTPSGRVRSADVWLPGLSGDPAVRARLHRPAGAPKAPAPALLWVHGGGHVIGDADQDDPLLDRLVAELGCLALAPDWRRAPEDPYPAALNDCRAALAWLHAQAEDLGVDPDRVVIAGASSGGGLAAGVALAERDEAARGGAGRPIAAQVLVYPMLDDRMCTPSSQSVRDPRVWNHTSNQIAWTAYLRGTAADAVSCYAAPARATDLRGLPPTWLGTAELDLFVDENLDYARRLMQAGVSCEVAVYRGAVHGFDLFAPDASVSRRFRRDFGEAMQWALGL